MGTRNRAPKPGGIDPGRPSDIDTRFKLGPDGTWQTVSEAIIQAIQEGEYLETAAPRCGVSLKTARGWLYEAGKTRIRVLGHQGPGKARTTAHQRKCLAFSDAYEAATATYEANTLKEIDEIARGGRRTVTVRSKRRFAGPQDTEGVVVERIETTATVPPDGQLLVWRLAHRIPGRYSPKLAVLTADELGGMSDDDTADALGDALEAFLAGREDAKAESEAKA